ncbi:MAG: PKD domain-containing protein, partial [Candidatus Eisenbacteria bacterium]
PSTGNAPLFDTADASGSSDSDGSVVSYRFDFGDGTIVGPQASSTATHTYAAGNWTANVLVTDDRGGTATASVPVAVTCGVITGPNLVGNPSFETNTTGWSGNGGGTIQRVAGGFDGGFSLEIRGPATGTPKFGVNDGPNWVASTPAAGTLYRFTAWVRSSAATGKGSLRVREYQGSSQKGVTTESPLVTLIPAWQKVTVDYTATIAGTTLDLQVLDAPAVPGEVFQTDNISIQIVTVRSCADRAPAVTAPATATVQAGSLLTVSVTASDPDGEAITSLTADLTGLPAGNDAQFSSPSPHTSGSLTWTPAGGNARPAPYNVTFTAANALSGSATTAITVVPPNQNPTAVLTISPSTGNAPLFDTADASGSSDSDGSVVSYRFDFGDGTIVGPQASSTATHTYAAGNWTASVLVTDNAGGTATASASVTVTSAGLGPNLVGNPSFETNTTGWSGNGGGTIQRVAGGLDGGYSLEIRGPATGTPTFGANDGPNWVASTPAAGTLYRFTAWVRSSTAAGRALLRVREYVGGSQKGVTTLSPAVTLTPTWQTATVDYTAAVSGSTLDFQVLDAPVATAEVFQTDNISIRIVGGGQAAPQITAPASPAAVVAPNPLRPDATVAFTTSREGAVSLRIYDATGRRVRTLLREAHMPAGRHAVRFDGRDATGRRLAAGIYFYRLEAGRESTEGRVLIIK